MKRFDELSPEVRAIERDYRAGELPVSRIARMHGVRRQTVDRLAQKMGWAREKPQPMPEERRREILARFTPAYVAQKLDALVAGMSVT
jgi:hypothetical protein